MTRFNLETYDPAADSSPGSDLYRPRPGAKAGSEGAAGFDGVIINQEDNACHCGCGFTSETIAKGKSKFLQGHDAKLKGILIRAHLAGAEVTVLNGGAISGDALGFAKDYGWVHFLADAQRRYAETKPKRDRSKNSTKTSGPKKGDAMKVKVGRWTHDGVVTKVTKSEITVDYTTKAGKTGTATIAH